MSIFALFLVVYYVYTYFLLLYKLSNVNFRALFNDILCIYMFVLLYRLSNVNFRALFSNTSYLDQKSRCSCSF